MLYEKTNTEGYTRVCFTMPCGLREGQKVCVGLDYHIWTVSIDAVLLRPSKFTKSQDLPRSILGWYYILLHNGSSLNLSPIIQIFLGNQIHHVAQTAEHQF